MWALQEDTAFAAAVYKGKSGKKDAETRVSKATKLNLSLGAVLLFYFGRNIQIIIFLNENYL